MAIAPPISDIQVQEFIIRAVRNVCTRMLKREATFVEKSADAAYAGFKDKLHFFGSVGFVGQIDGIIYLCIPDDFVQEAAGRVLGLSSAEIEMSGDAVLKDVVGEITNMTVGGFKNALCDTGFPCKLTLPTIVRGQNLSVAAMKSCARHMFCFECGGHRLVADIQIKLG